MNKKKINIIGGGCAGYSFIRRVDEINNAKFKFYTGNESKKDHFWGFWAGDETKDFDQICLKWNKWKIINYEGENTFHSNKHPYCVINRKKWISFCKKNNDRKLKTINEKVEEKNSQYFFKKLKLKGDITFDSRQPNFKKDILLQHFVGLTIEVKEKAFDFSTIILMDFRCDQSKGLHFIYLIPFSKNKALVESTLFSFNIEDRDYYINAITVYLKTYFKIKKFRVVNEEKGIIPMCYINHNNPNSVSIGARGGATRPSSGYTFIYIQRQVSKIINQINNNLKINNKVHNKFNLFMDRVFNEVLKKHPKNFPSIIYDIMSNLSGDEMALFMNGYFNLKVWLKIIFSMPKIIFIISLWKVITNV